jgi:hypothetical protein
MVREVTFSSRLPENLSNVSSFRIRDTPSRSIEVLLSLLEEVLGTPWIGITAHGFS